MDSLTHLKHSIGVIEQEILEFYELKHPERVVDFLMNREDLMEALAQDRASINDRGGVYLVTSGSEDVFLAVNFGSDVEHSVFHCDPHRRLCRDNLDAFWVLVEEISHFHLILDRSYRGVPVTKVELEWQGEVDKVLVSAIRLKEQSGDPHYHHLVRCLFDEASLIEQNDGLYFEASGLAARFWYDILSYKDGIADPARSPTLRTLLKRIYVARWTEKLDQIRRLAVRAA